jgi:hypothetical protein
VAYGQRKVDSSFRHDQPPGLSGTVNSLPERLEPLAGELAAELSASLPELVEGWYESMAQIPQLVSWRRPEVRALVLPTALSDIGRELRALTEGRRLPTNCPEEVLQSARLAATSGLPLWATLHSYRAGHAQQWRAWSDAVERRDLPREDRRALLLAGSDFFFAYADRCLRWTEIEYTATRELPLRRAEQRRMQLVARLLEGGNVDPGELGYEPRQWHLGVIVNNAQLEEAAAELARRSGAEVLTVAAEATTVWMWIGSESPAVEVRDELATLPVDERAQLAIGEPQFDFDGFRQTYRQAQVAAAIGGELGWPVIRYADVALEDLTSRDREQAAAFLSRELGPLAADTREARNLRATLTAYFACSQRASSAATQLGVHERTIGNRLRRAEELLGRPTSLRALELQVALRLHDLLIVPRKT